MPPKKDKTLSEGFWEKVGDRMGEGCWEWVAAKDSKGYGVMTAFGKAQFRAHRISWIINRGPIPNGLFVCHKCDNPSCVNPDHLFLGTQKQNMTDKMNKGRAVRKSTVELVEKIRGIRVKPWNKVSGVAAIARRFSIGETTVRRIMSGVDHAR